MEDWVNRGRIKNKGKHPAIEYILETFERGLGKNRVRLNGEKIVLEFNIGNKVESQQFTRFGAVALEEKIHFTTIPSENLVVCCLPIDSNTINNCRAGIYSLERLAEAMDCIIEAKKNGEVHTPVTQDDPNYLWTQRTGVDWCYVQGSDYGVDCIEPVLSEPVTEEQRRKEEGSVAYVALPANHVNGAMKEWLGYQREKENIKIQEWLSHRHGTKDIKDTDEEKPSCRSLVPLEWLENGGTDRAVRRVLNPNLQDSLAKTFQRG